MKKQNNIPENSVVSYASNGYKAISVPEKKKTALLNDFCTFRVHKKPVVPTEIKLSRNKNELLLEVHCFDTKPVHTENKSNGMSLFEKGDRIEIFFGAIEPVPWMIQFAIGAGGGKFDSQGKTDFWNADVTVNKTGWHVQLTIPLKFLQLRDLSCRFNLCRYRVENKECSTWSKLQTKFHETENFGELFFCDYDTAYFAKTGSWHDKKFMSRKSFETCMAKHHIPANTVLHGPFLSNPASHGMTITWTTAGMCAAALEYRLKGSKVWHKKYAGLQNAVLSQNNNLHTVHLDGLKENTSYEYRLINIHPLQTEQETVENPDYNFRTLNTHKKKFRFTYFSDIHSDTTTLKYFLEQKNTQGSDFIINAGDFLACMSGLDAFYQGFLDCMTEQYAKNKPLVFLRGNHEQVGLFAADYSRMFSHSSGKTYYTFRHGDCCFLLLDAGNDHPDDPFGIHQNTEMIREERQWLEDVVKSNFYRSAKHHIVCMHIPPFQRNKFDLGQAFSLVQNVFPADAMPDLLLCGHLHRYIRLMPDAREIITKKNVPCQIKNPEALPYPVIANDIDTCIVVDVTPSALQIHVVDSTGKTIDQLKIRR